MSEQSPSQTPQDPRLQAYLAQRAADKGIDHVAHYSAHVLPPVTRESHDPKAGDIELYTKLGQCASDVAALVALSNGRENLQGSIPYPESGQSSFSSGGKRRRSQ